MCDWAVKVAVADIKDEDIGGYVCNEVMELVVQAYFDYHKHNASVTVELPPKGGT